MCAAICIPITKAILIKTDSFWFTALIVNCFDVIQYNNKKKFLLSSLLFIESVMALFPLSDLAGFCHNRNPLGRG